MSRQAGQGFDRSEPNVRFIAIFGAGTLVLLVVAVLALQYYFDRVLEEQVFVKVQEPVAQTLVDLRAREDEELHSYRYLDREKATVRLPIERAMELLAEEAAQGKLRYPQRPEPVEIQGGANVPK
jgi:hypothetical protein